MTKPARKGLLHLLGIEANTTGHIEKLVSGMGGFLGILFILLITRFYVGDNAAALIVASMGASAVLLFAVPHGALSQPWPVMGGHVVSALIGVTCAKLVADPFVAAALAVSLAITAMYYLRCIHPPGGATALTAVAGGAAVHELGYLFVLTPVLLNAGVILLTAIAVNYPFPWRRYPASLVRRAAKAQAPAVPVSSDTEGGMLTHEDIQYALKEMHSFIDITEDDLARILTLASQHAQRLRLQPEQIVLGRCYSNGRYGLTWSVRQIIDERAHSDPERDRVIYKVVAGHGRRSTGTCTRTEFAHWAKYEVYRDENSWLRAAPTNGGRPEPA